jgi:uncharacterized repeat protein (TIGR03803 family)
MQIDISVRLLLAAGAVVSMLAGCNGGSLQVSPPLSDGPSSPANHISSGYKVLYSFHGGADGFDPFANLIFANGQLYGTTFAGGSGPSGGDGTVFKISPLGGKSIVYNFQGGADGQGPEAGLTAGSGGVLYGATVYGGGATTCSAGCGTVYELVPSGSGYTEKVLYAFQGGSDGSAPVGNLVVDQSGALYGTTVEGGGSSLCENNYSGIGCGTVFKLTPLGSGYTETILYAFHAGSDGIGPRGTLVRHADGVLYGTTEFGGGASACSSPSGNAGCGTVFTLIPSGSGYSENILYRFQGGSSDGSFPRSALLVRGGGVLVGTTLKGGANGHGAIYELTPSGSGYSESILFAFDGADGAAPDDVNGLYARHDNLFGTTAGGGVHYSGGTVFKLTASGSRYTETVLHKFKGDRRHDGADPAASLTADSDGTLFGTTPLGGIRNKGQGGYGTIFKISP